MNIIEEDLKNDIMRGDEVKSDLKGTCELLLNEKWKRRKTILKSRQIAKLSILEVIAEIYDIKFLQGFIDYITEYLTSNEGRGRTDIVDIAKYSIERENTHRKEMLDMMGKR